MIRLRSASTLLIAAGLSAADAPRSAAGGAESPGGSAPVFRIEAEDATLTGVAIADAASGVVGFSGDGFVTGFVEADARVAFEVEVPAGVYEVRVGYRAPLGEKAFFLLVNDLNIEERFAWSGEGFKVDRTGRVELEEGLNTIAIGRGWGYFDIDWVEVWAADPLLPPPPVDPTPTDPDATPEARELLRRLASLYGKATLSGVNAPIDADHVERVAGVRPAMHWADLMDFTPSRLARGAEQGDLVERQFAAAAEGAVVGLSWHWGAPLGLLDDPDFVDPQGQAKNAAWYKGFYTYATTLDVEAVMNDPDSAEHAALLADIDVIAETLRRYSDAGIPVLWRPLHEANGGWFWWGAKGAGPYVKLWRLMHDRLVDHHGLHNLVWVYTGGLAAYPGDAYCDLVGWDAYYADPRDPLTADWQALQDGLAGRKMLALTEFGKVPDVPRMQRMGVWWSFFASWTGDDGPRGMPDEEVRRIFTDPGVINLVDWKRVR